MEAKNVQGASDIESGLPAFSELEADARLRAAAPDLLESLQGLKQIIEIATSSRDGRQYAYIETRLGHFIHVVEALEQADAAIAKATGSAA